MNQAERLLQDTSPVDKVFVVLQFSAAVLCCLMNGAEQVVKDISPVDMMCVLCFSSVRQCCVV